MDEELLYRKVVQNMTNGQLCLQIAILEDTVKKAMIGLAVLKEEHIWRLAKEAEDNIAKRWT